MGEDRETGVALTRELAARASALRFDALPADVARIAGQSLVDFVAMIVVGSREPLVGILQAEAAAEGGIAEASAIGREARLPAAWAATINAAAGHTLAYDDVNMVIPGHGTAVAFPSALALAERTGCSGRDLLAAFVAGFETVATLGAVMEPDHYDRGFHASATLGTIGAAAAAAHVLGLPLPAFAAALEIAGSMAAGTKGVFGTMLKPFQVARACGNGVLAANLAARGLEGRGDALEARQGFVATHGEQGIARAVLDAPDGFFLRATLYKYHAACYLAHAPIEAALALRRDAGGRGSDASVVVRVNPMCDKVCNLARPATDIEVGYSIRTLTAMALEGLDTARPESLRIAALTPGVLALRERVHVAFDPALRDTAAVVTLRRTDGSEATAEADVGTPATDLADQDRRIRTKVATLLGERADPLIEIVANLPDLTSVAPLAAFLRSATGERGRGTEPADLRRETAA